MRTKVFWGALGFLAGALLTDGLAARASVTFVRGLRLAYQTEQEMLAACATERGDLDEAVLRYGNAVAAATSAGNGAWAVTSRGWPLGFSFMAVAYEALVPTPRLEQVGEGMERALLAHTLDQAGRRVEATAEYARAARLYTSGDVRAAQRYGAFHARTNAEVMRRSDPAGCYLSRTAGTAGVGAASSIR